MKQFAMLGLLAAAAAGLSAQTTFARLNAGHIVSTPSDSRSVNIADLNGDGTDDLVITNGPGGGGAADFVYINGVPNGSSFQTSTLNMPQANSSVGATIGDANNDGLQDLFVTTWYGQSNMLYVGGQGFASSFTFLAGSYSEAAAWGDYDNDGLLDLYVSNSYVNLQNALLRNVTLAGTPFPVLDNVADIPPVLDAAPSRGVSWIDYDNDGDLDLFVCNEENTPNALYRNDGNGQFTRILNAGDLFAVTRSTMSASWGDVNNDGHPDLFLANAGYFQPQANQLLLNNGDGSFSAKPGPWDTDGGCSYSSAFADYDNDGDLDLVVSNGFCGGAIVNFLYLNDGQGNFSRDENSISNLSTPCSYGVAWGDLNNNGFPDLAIATCRNTNQVPLPNNIIWLNQGNGNQWLKVKLFGTYSNQGGVGARLRLKTTIQGQSVWQMRDISTQTGYCSQNSLTAHFGLGDALHADSLIVEWPSGIRQHFGSISAQQEFIVIEEIVSNTTKTDGIQHQWRISPNPARDWLDVQGLLPVGASSCALTILDTNGRQLWEKHLVVDGHWQQRIDLQALGLAAGIYFLQINTVYGADNRRFVVVK